MSLAAYPEYKDTGIEWLGQVPAHWEVKKLKTSCRFLGGGTPSTEVSAYWDGALPWVSAKDMKREFIDDTEDHITEAGMSASAASLIPVNSILLVVRSGILKHTIPVAINTRELTINQDMRALVFDKTIFPAFFMRWVQGFQNDLLTTWRKQGATVESIEHAYLANTLFPVPPLAEQQAIAAWLDDRTGRIDEAVAAQRTLLEQLKEKRRALIAHAVTRGLDPAAPLKDSGIEWLGQVPAHWEVKRLKTLASERLAYGANESAEDDNPVNPRFIRITDINDDGTLRDETFKSLPHEIAEPYLLHDGDVLLARSGATVGKSFIYRPEWGAACYAGYLIRLRCDKQYVIPKWIHVFTQSPGYWAQIKEGAIQATIQNFSAEKYGEMRLSLPPLAEQQAIAAYLDAETAKLDTLAAETERAIALLLEHRAALIAEAVTGKIHVPGA